MFLSPVGSFFVNNQGPNISQVPNAGMAGFNHATTEVNHNSPPPFNQNGQNYHLSNNVMAVSQEVIALASMINNGQANVSLASALSGLAEKIGLLANIICNEQVQRPYGQYSVPNQTFIQPNDHAYISANQSNGQSSYFNNGQPNFQSNQSYGQNPTQPNQLNYKQDSSREKVKRKMSEIEANIIDTKDSVGIERAPKYFKISTTETLEIFSNETLIFPKKIKHHNFINLSTQKKRSEKAETLDARLLQPMINLSLLIGNLHKYEEIPKNNIKNIKCQYIPDLLEGKKIRYYFPVSSEFFEFCFTFDTEEKFSIERIAKFFFERIKLNKIKKYKQRKGRQESENLKLSNFVSELEGYSDLITIFNFKFKLRPDNFLDSRLNGSLYNFYFGNTIMKENFHFH